MNRTSAFKNSSPILSTMVLATCLCATSLSAELAIEKDVPDRGIHSLVPATRWEEGLLIGNGQMGGVIYGSPGEWTVALSHLLLGIPDHEAGPPPDLTDILPEIRSLIRAGKRWDASKLAWEKSRERHQIEEKMIWTDPFVNAANLQFIMKGAAEPDEYRRSLDYSTGLSRIQCAAGDSGYEQRAFMSRADNLLVLQLRARGDDKLNGSVQLLPGEHNYAHRLHRIEAPSVEGDQLSARFGFTLNKGGYEVLGHVKGDGGMNPGDNGTLEFKDASLITVFLRIQRLVGYDESEFEEIRADMQRCAKLGFDALLARHTAIHSEIYERVDLDLGGDPEQRAMPAESLWSITHRKKSTPALLERVFDAGRYQILCSSGYAPPNLQGIWGVGGARWRGDYTQNGNVPTAISNMLNGNMHELMLSYTGYLESLMDHHKANARQLYGARGIMLASRTHLDGYAQHYNAGYPHQFWLAGAPWAASFFYDYYLHTGSEEFLRKHALPWMEQSALFFEDFLIEDENGTYEFIPGYSPEIGGAAMNTTMDVAAVSKLLRNLIEAYRTLGLDEKRVSKWENMLTKMPEYRIHEGMLAEWIDPRMSEKPGHRHCSHFLPLWFGIDPVIAGDPELLEAARQAVLVKAKARTSSGVMAFGTAMTGWAAASLGEAETVGAVLENLSTHYYYKNFASSHNFNKKSGPEVFNADICGGMPALMIEMLVQSRPGEVTLLPALPEQLESGQLRGASCRGQIIVEELSWSPEEVKVGLKSSTTQKIHLRAKMGDQWKTATVELEAGKTSTHVFKKP